MNHTKRAFLSARSIHFTPILQRNNKEPNNSRQKSSGCLHNLALHDSVPKWASLLTEWHPIREFIDNPCCYTTITSTGGKKAWKTRFNAWTELLINLDQKWNHFMWTKNTCIETFILCSIFAENRSRFNHELKWSPNRTYSNPDGDVVQKNIIKREL